jgi:hypothetical protein
VNIQVALLTSNNSNKKQYISFLGNNDSILNPDNGVSVVFKPRFCPDDDGLVQICVGRIVVEKWVIIENE